MIYNSILDKYNKKKIFGILIDPDSYTNTKLNQVLSMVENGKVDLILIGGSLISSLSEMEGHISLIKKKTNVPVLLFPGSLLQITNKADGILLLSLISGRNPEFLIGNHVVAAPVLKNTNLEIIPTGYILIESGKTTSVEYISNTKPIPSEKVDIIVATAIAGEMIGNKLIYLEAGSGAENPVSKDVIEKVKKNINVPLMVGGGIRTKKQLHDTYEAGADIVIVGNAIEKSEFLR